MKASLLILCVFVLAWPASSHAQKSPEQVLREAELEMERSRLQILQLEADIARRRSESDRSISELNSFAAELARIRAERAAQAANEKAEAATRVIEQRRVKAEEALEQMREEMLFAEVGTRNNLYLLALVIAIGVYVGYVVRLRRREGAMKDSEKIGLIIVLASFLLAVLSLMISSNWYPRLDFLSNVMNTLRIQFVADEERSGQFWIDIPTKYLIFVFLCSAAYGFTTYLGITPAPYKKNATAQQDIKELT